MFMQHCPDRLAFWSPCRRSRIELIKTIFGRRTTPMWAVVTCGDHIAQTYTFEEAQAVLSRLGMPMVLSISKDFQEYDPRRIVQCRPS